MDVQELIDELEKIEDKSKKVLIRGEDYFFRSVDGVLQMDYLNGVGLYNGKKEMFSVCK